MKQFVDAYIWLFGGTKKAAKEIYRLSSAEYIESVISVYKRQLILAFYND